MARGHSIDHTIFLDLFYLRLRVQQSTTLRDLNPNTCQDCPDFPIASALVGYAIPHPPSIVSHPLEVSRLTLVSESIVWARPGTANVIHNPSSVDQMVDCRRSPAPYSYTTSTRMSVSSRSANESACPSVLRGGGVAANS